MLEKATGVIITTMKFQILMKVSRSPVLDNREVEAYQFAVVETAFAGARIFNGTISAGYLGHVS